jgi:hypothetical protein
MKSFIFLLSFFCLTGPSLAQAPRAVKCSFTRHQFIQVEGEKLPVEIKNKILNSINPDHIKLVKEKKDLGLALCSALHPLKKIKDVPLRTSRASQESVITTITLTPKNDFWQLALESFERLEEKSEKLRPLWAPKEFKSLKSIKDIKNSELADWVLSQLESL